ncbi:MAG: hypothetical protein L0Y58_23790, partial [Verrucomicrobia subdivision 3 bacterium]|nr:hypothetical protein [Limisphaerales bacterium]
TTDPRSLLGLACLARAGSPVRREIADVAVRLNPEYRPVVSVLTVTMDGIDERAVGELIRQDPDNALGHYLRAMLCYAADRDSESREAYRRAAHCSELRLFEPVTGAAILKAVDALDLGPRDRLCALSWMACRSASFTARVMQWLSAPLGEFARDAARGVRQEISGLLVSLAGHLFATNYYNRWAAKQALEHAMFGLNVTAPDAGMFQTMIGDSSARSLIGTMARWPHVKAGIDHEHKINALRLAQGLPDWIRHAFRLAAPSSDASEAGESTHGLSDFSKARLQKLRQNAAAAANALIDVALTDIDGILGPYLRGIPLERSSANGRQIVPEETPVERLMRERPDVFSAAAGVQAAMAALGDVGASDPSQRNISRMMEIHQAMVSYAATHDDTYPSSIDVLFDSGYLKAPLKPRSVVTGKPYVYVAAGEKVPRKLKDKTDYVVLFDDAPDRWGYCQCVFASWIGGAMRVEDLRSHLQKRAKLDLIS